jgi:hypothetical protein
MKKASQTTNPLHFEDLEPHRFEDLVRQLIYEFRPWKSLEATGRSGSEQGFDVRGLEATDAISTPDSDMDEEEPSEETQEVPPPARVWLVQCKREKSISPKKLEKYSEDIQDSGIYGVIFAAACDFSKKARDVFHSSLQKKNIQEIHIWGKAELEDMLFQPKNDNLLFAYFGISLVIRHRSLRTQIRSKLAMKRKAINSLGELRHQDRKKIVIRDANGSSYPFEDAEFAQKPNWHRAFFLGHYYDGIICKVKESFAYLHEDKKQWDYVSTFNEMEYTRLMWQEQEDDKRRKRWEERERIVQFWRKAPADSQAVLEVFWFVPYESIVAIDGDGDAFEFWPHIYVPFDDAGTREYAELKVNNQVVMRDPQFENRIKFFPETFPELEDKGNGHSAVS